MPHQGIERARRAKQGHVILNDIMLKLSSPITMELVNIIGRKENQGEPGPDDHPFNSSWIQGSWLGGGQIYNSNPASHVDRFWWAEANTEHPRAGTLPPLTYEYLPDTESEYNPICMGEFPPGNASRTYFSWGADLQIWDETSKSFSNQEDLSLPPVRNWTVWATYMAGSLGAAGTRLAYIPQGSGYEVFNGTSVVHTSIVPAIDFAIWDNKLFRLDATGVIDFTLDGVTWQAAALVSRIPDGSTPRRLIAYKDDRDEPVLMVITDGSYFLLDFNFATLRQTDTFFPRHPYHGIAAAVWRAQLFTGVGIGIQMYQPGVLDPGFGLDRGDSLPSDYRGYISDFASEYNSLYVMVAGIPTGGSAPETAGMYLGGGDDQLYVGTTSRNALLMKWNGNGYHYVWSGANETPTNVEVCNAQGMYRLWWGAGGKAHTMVLPVTYYNPRDTSGFEYAPDGYLETGWWNWGWEGTYKVAKKIELETERCSETETIRVEFKVDNEDNSWQLAGVISTNGEHHLHLGLDEDLSASFGGIDMPMGVVHEKIRLRFKFSRGSDTTARPILKWHSVIARKFLLPQRTWRIAIDNTDRYGARSVSTVTQLLESMAISQGSFTLITDESDEVYITDMVSFSMDGIGGPNGESYIRINLVETNEAEDHIDVDTHSEDDE